MANTSLTLGEHWESFIKQEITSGRYASASEVVRSALRMLEEHKTRSKLDELRSALIEGEKSGISQRSVEEIKQAVIQRKIK